jgi:hypothetical protein
MSNYFRRQTHPQIPPPELKGKASQADSGFFFSGGQATEGEKMNGCVNLGFSPHGYFLID